MMIFFVMLSKHLRMTYVFIHMYSLLQKRKRKLYSNKNLRAHKTCQIRLTRDGRIRIVKFQQSSTHCAVKSKIYFRVANRFQSTCARLLLVKLIIENRLNKLTAAKILCWYSLQFDQHWKQVCFTICSHIFKKVYLK